LVALDQQNFLCEGIKVPTFSYRIALITVKATPPKMPKIKSNLAISLVVENQVQQRQSVQS
jgi:hypothetical protein